MGRIWFSRRALGLHAVIIVIVPTFMALCIWQLRRALSGNELSWAYVFEWPFFAGYALYMWWRFVHDVPPETANAGAGEPSPRAAITAPGGDGTEGEGEGAGGAGAGAPGALGVTARGGSGDPDPGDPEAAELAAYNQYLAALAAEDARTQRR